jgi:hypothetical protein
MVVFNLCRYEFSPQGDIGKLGEKWKTLIRRWSKSRRWQCSSLPATAENLETIEITFHHFDSKPGYKPVELRRHQ